MNPVVVIGAGPIGLTAAAHLLERGLDPLVLEAGDLPGAHLLKWGHVRMFSPWKYNIDRVAAALLLDADWSPPDPEAFPTGGELQAEYVAPLADVPALRDRVRYGTRVVAVTRAGHDKMKDGERTGAPFIVHVETSGESERIAARAVIDASGTFGTPNPLGDGGVAAPWERDLRDRIFYGVPDVLGTDRARYAGKRTVVVGAGDSAFNALYDLAKLAGEEPGTEIVWAIRSGAPAFGGGAADQLPERGALGTRVERLLATGKIALEAGFRIDRIEASEAREGGGSAKGGRLTLHDGPRAIREVEEVVAATGYRPDLSILGEVRLELDPATESPRALGPLIDPNIHSCGTVPPHGYEELRHPEEGLFIVGMKSYGRAPTFLLMTGYEQVRSIVAALAGDLEAAREVRLVLPETGVCSAPEPVHESETEPACCAPTCCGKSVPA